MATEKPWYTRIKTARKGANAQDVADWYREANIDMNPYTYRKVPKALVPFYFYGLSLLNTTYGDETKKISVCSKEFLNSFEMVKREEMLFYSLWQLIHLTELIPPGPIQPKIQNYISMLDGTVSFKFPAYGDSKSSIDFYQDFLEFDTIFLEIAKAFDYSDDKELTNILYFEVFYKISNIWDVMAQRGDIRQEREKNYFITQSYFISIITEIYFGKLKDVTLNGDLIFKILIKNLPKYARYFPYNKSNKEKILSEELLESFKTYIIQSSKTDDDLYTYLITFFSQLWYSINTQAQINSESKVFDSYHVRPRNDGSQMFKTHLFRTDFTYEGTPAINKKFSKEEYNSIAECFFQERKGFSQFLQICKEKDDRQQVIDSILSENVIPGCKENLKDKHGFELSKDKAANFSDIAAKEKKAREDALLKAISDGDLAGVNATATTDSVNNTDALHLAIEKGNLDIFKRLVGVPGINLDKPDPSGDSPLEHAIKKANVDIVNELLSRKDISLDRGAFDRAIDLANKINETNPNKAAILEGLTKRKKAEVISGKLLGEDEGLSPEEILRLAAEKAAKEAKEAEEKARRAEEEAKRIPTADSKSKADEASEEAEEKKSFARKLFEAFREFMEQIHPPPIDGGKRTRFRQTRKHTKKKIPVLKN